MKQSRLEPEFVDEIPANLSEGRLYISIRYRTASHLCACGCGLKVVTPIKPPKWHLTYDGETVSFWPSIGRWQLPCRSHYVIRQNRVVWAKPWTEKQILKGREEDAEDLHRYYSDRRPSETSGEEKPPAMESSANTSGHGLLHRLRERFR
jgi:hypothetical protein